MKKLFARIVLASIAIGWALIMVEEYGGWGEFLEACLAMACLTGIIVGFLLIGLLYEWALKTLWPLLVLLVLPVGCSCKPEPTPTPHMYAYYVTFNWAGSNGYGWGSRVITSNQKLDTELSLKNVTDYIQTNNFFTNVGIVSFYELKPQ